MIRRTSILASLTLCLLHGTGAQGAILAPGTLYALVFDFATSQETVVVVDPLTGGLTPVGAGVPDCCTVGGFPVSALDSATGGLYIAGNLLSDPPASDRRLLGFDVVGGGLSTSPYLPTGFNYNRIQIDHGAGTLYGLVFDFGPSLERVTSVDPVTAVLAPVGPAVADCCTLGGFEVAALDPVAGAFYAAGNRLSDPPGSAKRLLGFDVASGALVTNPLLPAGFGYNEIALDPLTGTLYGLVFDFGTSQETVVTIDPLTAALSPVGGGNPDCCLMSGFSALDPHNGVFYSSGNLLSDPAGPKRLLGFDLATGALVTSPFLPAGFNYNLLEAVVVLPAANQPPVAQCTDVTVSADPGLCAAAASIDDGSFDPDGDPITLTQEPAGPYPLGDTLVTLIVDDGLGGSDTCQGTATVVDGEAPVASCNSPATITPPDAPISFTATAVDDCGPAAVEILGFDCWKFTRKGRRVDKTASCVVAVTGATVTIADSGGVGDHIGWEVHATDGGGNEVLLPCELEVVNPARP